MQSPFSPPLFKCLSMFLMVVGLSGCGSSGSDSDSDYSDAYLQFYNASPNGALVYVREVDDGDVLGNAEFGDITTLITLDEGDAELEFYRFDADDQEVVIDTLTVSMRNGYKNLVTMHGDFAQPQFNVYQYERSSIEDSHFRLLMLDLTTAAKHYDVYLSDSGEPFSAANYIGEATTALNEMNYWDGDDTSDDFNQGDYTLYLTEPGGSEVLFESPTLTLSYQTEYVFAVRELSGAMQTGLSVDVILNSSTVTSITDVDADAQFRLYSAIDSEMPVSVILTDEGDSTFEFELSAFELTDFTGIKYGDYQISAALDGEMALSNQLVTLNQSESKAIVLYQDDGVFKTLSFIESGLPQAYDKSINFINLVNDYDHVDFYLVRKDETVDTAEYRVASVGFAEVDDLLVPGDYYEIIAVYEDVNDQRILLARTPLTAFEQNVNYIISLQETTAGFAINLLPKASDYY